MRSTPWVVMMVQVHTCIDLSYRARAWDAKRDPLGLSRFTYYLGPL